MPCYIPNKPIIIAERVIYADLVAVYQGSFS